VGDGQRRNSFRQRRVTRSDRDGRGSVKSRRTGPHIVPIRIIRRELLLRTRLDGVDPGRDLELPGSFEVGRVGGDECFGAVEEGMISAVSQSRTRIVSSDAGCPTSSNSDRNKGIRLDMQQAPSCLFISLHPVLPYSSRQVQSSCLRFERPRSMKSHLSAHLISRTPGMLGEED
jgi:hypothetical protein